MRIFTLLVCLVLSFNCFAGSYVTCQNLADRKLFSLGTKLNVGFVGVPSQVKGFFRVLKEDGFKEVKRSHVEVVNEPSLGRLGRILVTFHKESVGYVPMFCQWNNY